MDWCERQKERKYFPKGKISNSDEIIKKISMKVVVQPLIAALGRQRQLDI